MAIKHWISFALCVSLPLASCGGGEMTMTDYVERVDAIFDRGFEQYEAVVVSPQGQVLLVGQGGHLGFADQGAQLTNFTPWDLHVALGQVAEIQAEALGAAAAVDPPDQIADLHALYFRALPISLDPRQQTSLEPRRRVCHDPSLHCWDVPSHVPRTADLDGR
jgi:hypothetical protein